ncbi:MAG: diaminopimelate decarboxylase [Chloroflexi bacterium]|nr:diaminopimelate decarboxylase [Chloroflexota bacterium]
MSLLDLFPDTAQVNSRGHLSIGGCDLVDLAAEAGTPLYIFDEATLRQRCRSFVTEFGQRHPQTTVAYACKAFINRGLAAIFREEGLGLDVVSGGELAIAHAVEFPLETVYFHGNNKSAQELELALDWSIGRVVVDNFHELALLQELARARGRVQDILLRLSPGIDPHTHQHTTTGIVDSKFGFTMITGQAETALAQALAASHLRLIGLHCHLGSPIFEMEPYRQAIEVVLDFAARMRAKYGFQPAEISPGGGFAVTYTTDSPAPPIAEYAETIVSALRKGYQGSSLPRLVVEPGRAIVAQAGVALYRVGATKDIPGVRCYVSVDGGMSDNIRPAIYGARYQAAIANRMEESVSDSTLRKVTLAGKFCESGDILIRDIELPPLSAGDLVAVPVSGAYCLAMASNYNASLKPAVVLVNEGMATLIRRRETYDDLMRCDVGGH